MKKTNETISDDKNRTLKVTNVRRTSVGPLPDIRIYRHKKREHSWACHEYPGSPGCRHNDPPSSPVYQPTEIQNLPEHHLTDLFSNMSDLQKKRTSSKNIQAYIADSKSDLKELIKVLGDRIKHFEDKFDKTTELTRPTKYLRSKGTIYNEADFQREESSANKERNLRNNDLQYDVEENNQYHDHQGDDSLQTTTRSQAAVKNKKHPFENIEPISSLPLYLFHKTSPEPKQPEESWSNIIKGVADSALINVSMEFMDSEQVIIEVRKYPCLYDINDEFYKDKNVKKEAWKCVANNVSGGTLQTMSLECQNEYEKDLHKKWRSLRDAFTRACRTTHLEPRRISGKPKKPYVYYKQMSFLLPNIQLKPAFIQMPEPIHIKEEQAILGIESEPEFTEEIIPEYNEIVKEEVDEFSDTHLEKKRRLESIEEDERKTFENLSNTTTDKIEDDPDKMFLLSLLPNFKKIKSSDKLDIQIKIMQMLKNRLDSY